MKMVKEIKRKTLPEDGRAAISEEGIPMGKIGQDNVTIGLEHLFADSIIPQLFVDSEMVLRDFTPPVGELFSIDSEDRGRSIYEVKEKIGHRCLIGNIRGVLYTERNLEKEVEVDTGERFKLNIQPNFSPGEELVNGVIITFFQI